MQSRSHLFKGSPILIITLLPSPLLVVTRRPWHRPCRRSRPSEPSISSSATPWMTFSASFRKISSLNPLPHLPRNVPPLSTQIPQIPPQQRHHSPPPRLPHSLRHLSRPHFLPYIPHRIPTPAPHLWTILLQTCLMSPILPASSLHFIQMRS